MHGIFLISIKTTVFDKNSIQFSEFICNLSFRMFSKSLFLIIYFVVNLVNLSSADCEKFPRYKHEGVMKGLLSLN